MKNPLFVKCLLLILMGFLLTLSLGLIEDSIEERARYRSDAILSIANGFAAEQVLASPVLVFPYSETFTENNTFSMQTREIIITPKNVHLDGQINTEKRAYGLHETAVFTAHNVISGEFVIPDDLKAQAQKVKDAKIRFDTPYLSLGISDVRGITGEPKINVNGQNLPSARGSNKKDNASFLMEHGIHAKLPVTFNEEAKTISFRIDLDLAGTSAFTFVPLGDASSAELKSNWAHPSFGGDFLPRTREINAQGFSAKWATSALASYESSDFMRNKNQTQQKIGFSVRFIEPVDIYRQATRAVKYGILFIILGFAAFFAFEHLKNLPIHPIQYLLIGLAQAVFFLLLTSLSEHIVFWMAYLGSAAASILLIAIYLSAVLQSLKRSIGFSSALGALYAALFAILQAEENAFLLGSLLIFAALAALMIVTRRINWYQIAKTQMKEA